MSADWPPGGSQTVTTTSTVSITSIVVVMVISCLLSKGMAEEKTERAPKARLMDSFIVSDDKALDVNKSQLGDQ